MVAAVVALVIMAGAIALLVQSANLERRQKELSTMNRDAERVIGQMAAEVRQAGLGRPRGARFTSATTGAELFPPIVLKATPTEFAFVGDLPRPNSNFNGISYLADAQPSATNRLAILNELNGDCDVYSSDIPLTVTLPAPLPPISVTLTKCATSARSTLFPASTLSCNVPNDNPSNNAPSCPWGLGKYRGDEFIILADNTGKWLELQLDSGSPPIDTTGNRKTLKLASVTSNALTLIPAMVSGTPNRAVISTPDRVFYRLVPEPSGPLFQLERKQCWGQLTNTTTGTVGFESTRTECPQDTASKGTNWEVLQKGLTANGVRFFYFDGNGKNLETDLTETDLTKLERIIRRVRRVTIQMNLERPLRGSQKLEHSTITSIHVRN
jgi:hypothetical protein